MESESYDFYSDEADEFQETELDYVERGKWDDLLSLYERELEHVGAADEEEANDLRSRIEAVRERIRGDTGDVEYRGWNIRGRQRRSLNVTHGM